MRSTAIRIVEIFDEMFRKRNKKLKTPYFQREIRNGSLTNQKLITDDY
jgi:hypothetical protein